VVEATAVLNEAQADLARAQGLSSEVRRTLEVLAGRFPSAELEVAQGYAPLPPPVAAGLPTPLLKRRPDILAAESQVVAAFRALNASRLALLPTIVLTAEGGRLSNRVLDVLKLNRYLIATGLGLFQPIFEGARFEPRSGSSQRSRKKRSRTTPPWRRTRFARSSLRSTTSGVLAERLQYQNQALANWVEAVRIATARYQAGALSLQPVLQLQASQLATKAGIISCGMLSLSIASHFISRLAAALMRRPPLLFRGPVRGPRAHEPGHVGLCRAATEIRTRLVRDSRSGFCGIGSDGPIRPLAHYENRTVLLHVNQGPLLCRRLVPERHHLAKGR
jgi:hypothetical protein